jgi:hypothetical protein
VVASLFLVLELILINQSFKAQAHTTVTKEKAVLEAMAVRYRGPSDLGYRY